MQIEKILIVESPIQLYRLIKAKEEEILDLCDGYVHRGISFFLDCVEMYETGCKCDRDAKYEIMMEQYSYIREESDIVSHLVRCFECDRIEFK